MDFASHVKDTSALINEDSPNLESNRGAVSVEPSQTFDTSVGGAVGEVSGTAAPEQSHSEDTSDAVEGSQSLPVPRGELPNPSKFVCCMFECCSEYSVC